MNDQDKAELREMWMDLAEAGIAAEQVPMLAVVVTPALSLDPVVRILASNDLRPEVNAVRILAYRALAEWEETLRRNGLLVQLRQYGPCPN